MCEKRAHTVAATVPFAPMAAPGSGIVRGSLPFWKTKRVAREVSARQQSDTGSFWDHDSRKRPTASAPSESRCSSEVAETNQPYTVIRLCY